MSDEGNEPEGKEEEETGAKPAAELGDAGKRALDAERSARRKAEKELGELKSRLQAIEDEGKSEVEKLRGQVAELTKQAEAAVAKADRFEVAAAKGLSLAQARRLVGSTKDELEADADSMLEELGIKREGDKKDDEQETPQDERPLGRPKENLRDGAAPAGDDDEPDPGKLAESLLKSPF